MIAVLELEKTNAVIINQKIIQTLTDLNKGEINYKNLKLVISDGAPYAVKVGKLLKSLFEDLKHVTCFCHMLHRIYEFIRSVNKILDYFKAEFKRFFIKTKVNKYILTGRRQKFNFENLEKILFIYCNSFLK